jgi:hypothetical protein
MRRKPVDTTPVDETTTPDEPKTHEVTLPSDWLKADDARRAELMSAGKARHEHPRKRRR